MSPELNEGANLGAVPGSLLGAAPARSGPHPGRRFYGEQVPFQSTEVRSHGSPLNLLLVGPCISDWETRKILLSLI